ncbi:MAG: type II toxin-antitoxin system prevent-host-death family antitoxin [Burkholderiales bacterium]|nr:type II toxin-antitoxin system prevent-host-death family antitoxin [Phycisphaerae bacterium]
MGQDSIGTFEAKAQLSQLLDRVALGETITITRHGTPIARLVPVNEMNRSAAREATKEWKQLRAGNRLGAGLSIKALRAQGRR